VIPIAAIEMYDYVATVSADNNQTLSVSPRKVLTEEGSKNQVIHVMDDNSEERIDFGTADISIFHVMLQWTDITASDAGTLMLFWHGAAYGNGCAESFKWTHPTDGHTYVVRFDCDLPRSIRIPEIHGVTNVKLKVLGRIVDA